MWKLSSVVNLNTPLGQEPQVYNVFALVPLGAQVSNRLILRQKSTGREDLLTAVDLHVASQRKSRAAVQFNPRFSQFHE